MIIFLECNQNCRSKVYYRFLNHDYTEEDEKDEFKVFLFILFIFFSVIQVQKGWANFISVNFGYTHFFTFNFCKRMSEPGPPVSGSKKLLGMTI
jgi:hypothetical protein